MIETAAHYLNLFQADIALLTRMAREQGLSTSGDYCDFYFEDTVGGSLSLRDGKVSSGAAQSDFGVGVRVLHGEKTGYAYSESVAPEDLSACVKAAARIAEGGLATPVSPFGTSRPRRGVPNPLADRYPIAQPWQDASQEAFVAFLQRLDSLVRAKDARVEKVLANLSFQTTRLLMCNSLGECCHETRPLGTVTVSAVFRQGGKTENKSASRSFRAGAEMLSPQLAETLAQEVCKGIDARLEAQPAKGGKMPVVMGAGASGILLHEAMGHAFEADFNRKGTSIFADKLGKAICPAQVSIYDDATLRADRGALNFDDELIPGQRTCMVEEGVLTSYLHDRMSAAHYGVSPTGNGRRESFRHAPIPRMRCTYMAAGDAKPDELIASVAHGVYVDEFSNGQVQIGEGDFTFFVKSGFLIEGGKLTRPIKDINIIGNGPRALADIRGVGNDLVIDPGAWTCGKGQSVPVSCGIPTVLVENLTVGGLS